MSSAAIQAGKAVITVGLDPKGVDRGISEMSRQLKGLSTAFREVGFEVTALSGAISYGLVRALKLLDKPLRISAHIEAATISFEVLTGSARMAIDTVKELRAFASVSPLKFEGLAQASETLLAYGVSARRVVKDIKLLGQVSRGDQTRLTRLALSYGQVAAKGRLYASEMRQFTESGFNPLQIMVERTGKTMGVLLKEMENGQVRFEDVRQAFIDATSAGGRFFGLLEKQSQSLGGHFFRMVDAVEQALQPIGDALAEPLKAIMRSVMDVAREMRTFLIANHNLVRGIVGGTLVLTTFSVAVTGVGLSLLAIGAAGRIFSTVLKTLGYFSKVSFKATTAQLGSVTVAASDMSVGVVTAATEASGAIKILDKSIKGITVGMAVEMRKLEVAFVKGFAKASAAVNSFASALTVQSARASKALTTTLGASFNSLQPVVRSAMTKAGESYRLGWDRIHTTSRLAAVRLRNGLTNAFSGLAKSTMVAMKGVERAYISGWSVLIKYSKVGGKALTEAFKLALLKMPVPVTRAMNLARKAYITGWSLMVSETPSSGALLRAAFKSALIKLPATMTQAMALCEKAYVSGWAAMTKSTGPAGKAFLAAFKLQLKGLKVLVAEAMLTARAAYKLGWEKLAASSAAGGKVFSASFAAAFKGIASIVAVEMAAINLSVSSSVELLGQRLIGLVTATNAAIAAKTAELQVYAATLRGVVAEIGGASTAAGAAGVKGAAGAKGATAAGTVAGATGAKKRGTKKSEMDEFADRIKAAIITAKTPAEKRKRGGQTGPRGPYKKKSDVDPEKLTKKVQAKAEVKVAKAAVSTAVATAAASAAVQVAEIVATAEEASPKAARRVAQTISTQRTKRRKPGLKPRPENLARLQAEAIAAKRRGLLGGDGMGGASGISGIVPASPNRIRVRGPGRRNIERNQRLQAAMAKRDAEIARRAGRVTVNSEKERRRALARAAQGRPPATIPRRPGPNFVPYRAPNAMIPFDPAFAAQQERSTLGFAPLGEAPFLGPGGRDDVQAMREEKAAARANRKRLEAFRTGNRLARNRPDVEFPSQRLQTFPVTGPMNFNQPFTREEARKAAIASRIGGLRPSESRSQLAARMTPSVLPVPPSPEPPRLSKVNPGGLAEKQRRRAAAAQELLRRQDPAYMQQFQAGQRERVLSGKLAGVRRPSLGQRIGGALAGMVDPAANLAGTKRIGAAAGGVTKFGGKIGGVIGGAGKSMLSPIAQMGGVLKALLVPVGIVAAKFAVIAVVVAGVAALFVKVAKNAGVLDEIATGMKSTFASVYGWVSQVVTTLFKAAKMGEIGAMLSYAFAEAKFGFLVFVQSMFKLLPEVVGYGSELFIALGKTIIDVFSALPGLIWGALTGATKISMEVFTSMFALNMPGKEGGALDASVKAARSEADRQRVGINARSSERDAKAAGIADADSQKARATEAENTRLAEQEEAAVRIAAENARIKGLSDSGVDPSAFGLDPEVMASSQKSAKDRVKALVDENIAIYQAARGNKNYLDVINGVSSAMIAASQSASDLNEVLKAGEKLNERIKDAQSSTFAVFDGGGALQERKAAIKAIFDADQKSLQLRKEAAALEVAGTDPANQSAEFSDRQKILSAAIASTAGSSRIARNNFLKLNEALRAEAFLTFAETIKALGDDIEALVLGADAAERLKLQRQGLNKAELDAIDGLKQQKKVLEERAEADKLRKERAAEIRESLKTPAQQLAQSQKEIADLQARGLLSQNEAAAAFSNAIRDANAAAIENAGKSGFTANRVGSGAAMEARRTALGQLQGFAAAAQGAKLAADIAKKAVAAKNDARNRDIAESLFKQKQLTALDEIKKAILNQPKVAMP